MAEILGPQVVKKAGPLTWALLGVLVVFGFGDFAATVTGDGKAGTYGETVSTFIHHLEKGRPWVRGIVGVLCLDMLSHLTFGTKLLIV